MPQEDVICPICANTVTIPVIFKILPCGCKDKQRYCLTCVRDSLNMNGFANGAKQYSIKTCPTCRAPLDFPEKLNKNTVYEIDEILMNSLDETFGETYCPRDCEWRGLRKNISEHLKVCDNTYRFKCKQCSDKSLFDKKGFRYHLETRGCERYYHSCLYCKIIGIDGDDELEKHKLTCPGKGNKMCKKCGESVLNDHNSIISHLIECMFTDPWIVAEPNYSKWSS